MITLKMLKLTDGTQQPKELIIGDQVHMYKYESGKTESEFFKLLEKFIKYKINVEYYNIENELIKTAPHIVRSVSKNAAGVATLKLD